MKLSNDIPKKEEEFLNVIFTPSSHSPQTSKDVLPKKLKYRRCTDVFSFVIFVAALVLLTCLLMYTLSYSDMNRYKGFDNCGNICGMKNVKNEEWNCTGQDMTSKPYYNPLDGTCSSFINTTYYQRMGEVLPFSKYCLSVVGQAIQASLMPLGFSLIFLLLIRYATATFVWGVLILSMFSAIIGIIVMPASIEIIITIGIILASLFIWLTSQIERIKIVTALYKETAKIAFEIPSLCWVPVITMAVLSVITLTYTIILVHLRSAGILGSWYGSLTYVPNGLMIVTQRYINHIVTIWLIQFVNGVAYTTVSGAVTNWFFSRNPHELDGIVKISFLAAASKHVGTIALGSLVISLMTPVKLVLICLAQIWMLNDAVVFLLRYVDGFCTRNAYIMTAMYGTSFIDSGKRATKHLKLNIGGAVVIDQFGDFVITLAQALVVAASASAAAYIYNTMQHEYTYDAYFFIFIMGIIYMCIFATLGAIRVAASTIYFCVCEDFLLNEETDQLLDPISTKTLLSQSNRLFIEKIQEKLAPKANMEVVS